MKKVFVMPSLAIDGERIDKVVHVDGLDSKSLRDMVINAPFPDGFFGGVNINSDDFQINRASLAIEIEAAVELPSPRDDIWKTLIDDDRMNIVIKDESGRELHIPNAQIIQRVRITGRIPRKMKKHLKRIHGADWKQYHPNAENEVNINSK
jgi:hypothetical protein